MLREVLLDSWVKLVVGKQVRSESSFQTLYWTSHTTSIFFFFTVQSRLRGLYFPLSLDGVAGGPAPPTPEGFSGRWTAGAAEAHPLL